GIEAPTGRTRPARTRQSPQPVGAAPRPVRHAARDLGPEPHPTGCCLSALRDLRLLSWIDRSTDVVALAATSVLRSIHDNRPPFDAGAELVHRTVFRPVIHRRSDHLSANAAV